MMESDENNNPEIKELFRDNMYKRGKAKKEMLLDNENLTSENEWHEFRWNDPLQLSPSRYKKLKIYADENIPFGMVDLLREIGIPTKAAVENGMASHPDQNIYQKAKKTGRVLLTMDRDFWNDRKHPLQRGPGIIFVDISPGQPEKAVHAFARFYYLFAKYWPLDWWENMKVQITESGFTFKFRTWKGSIEEYEFRFMDDGRLLERRLK